MYVKLKIHFKQIFESREAYIEHKETYLHFECKPCNVAYLTNKELRAHNDQPECRAYICPHCGVNFQTADPRKKAGRNRYFNFYYNKQVGWKLVAEVFRR